MSGTEEYNIYGNSDEIYEKLIISINYISFLFKLIL